MNFEKTTLFARLVDRFAPQQRTNYTDLFNEWAVTAAYR